MSRTPILLPLLASSTAIGIIATGIYVPSVPDMAREFAVDVSAVQLTLTLYLMAFGLCQLVHGPLSDRYGRRPVLLAGLGLCAIASAACAAAPDVEFLLVARIVQAVGACAATVVVRAVIRDVFERSESARALSVIGMTLAMAPALAPVIGGHLHVWFGWRANFILVCVLALCVMSLSWRLLPETNTHRLTRQGPLGSLFAGFALLLRDANFWGHALVIAGIFAGLYAFQTGASVLLIDRLGVNARTFGFLAAMPTLAFFAGSLVTNRLVVRLGTDRLLGIGAAALALGGACMSALALAGAFTVISLVGPMLLFTFGMGLALPNALAGAVGRHPRHSGAGSALAGCLQMAAAACSSMLVLSLPQVTPLPLASIVGAASLLGLAGWLLLSRRPGVPPGKPPPATER